MTFFIASRSTQLVGVRAPGTGNKQGWLKGYQFHMASGLYMDIVLGDTVNPLLELVLDIG